MNLLHIVDLKDGHIQISWQCGNALIRAYQHPLPFADPLSTGDRAELRWYLEEYLQFPYGAERDRAAKVERQMEQWGEALFQQVFAKGECDPGPRMFYQEAVREGLDQCEVCISSEDPAFLNVPWELVRDPASDRGYLAPMLAGLFRQRSGQKIETRSQSSSDGAFRILLVIARPFGERDIPLGTVARPVLEAVRPLRPQVELEVLRPPTFDALVARLNEQRGRYHLVHFDGHGVLGGSVSGFHARYSAKAGYGHLVFEREDGQAHIVSSQDLRALATPKVPLFVLNACQSAEEGPANPFSSVASQLIAIGSKGVVAMSYSVYAATAALFMRRFYERLIAHASLSQAVAAARLSLFTNSFRPSPVGPLQVRDWVVPALYLQERGYTPIPSGATARAGDQDQKSQVVKQKAEQVCPEGRFGFVGRDSDLLQIERALRKDDNPWVLLVGMGGSGKTELAFGFARWYAETGGCPGGVFATTFKEKANWCQVVGSIMGFGTDFSLLSEGQQREVLVKYLREKACLLVWDNLETVAGYHQGAVGLATEEERGKLARFLQALQGGKTRVIITTRKPDEAWLGIAYQSVQVKGLTGWYAAELAERILRTVGKQPQDWQNDPDYSRLLRLLRGHPRSLEVVLPRLRYEAPAAIINALQHRIDAAGDVLDASLTYAFQNLSDRAQKQLPLVGLFTSHVLVQVIVDFISAGDEQGSVYREVVGEMLDAAGWTAVMQEAAGAGLLISIDSSAYELHPTLPTFLRQRLAAQFGADTLARLDREFMTYYAAWSALDFEALRRGEGNVVLALGFEEANLLRALRLAQLAESWEEVRAMVQTLDELYAISGRNDERAALRRQAIMCVGYELLSSASRERASLWMFLVGSEAIDLLSRNELEKADEIYKRILDYLLKLGDPAVEPHVATTYHQLGTIAEERKQFDQAEVFYRKALAIYKPLGLERDVADEYHQLGIIAQEQQQLDQAEPWYRKALAIYERLGLERAAANDYYQLAIIAQERQQFDQAETGYRKALEVYERLGLEREAADVYHQLGRIAEERQQFDQAEAWYRKALAVYEPLGLERNATSVYYQLGRIAQERQQFDQAEVFYRKALEITERLGLEPEKAAAYHQLGIIAQERQQFDQAEAWYRRALEVKERLGLEREAANDYHQLGMLAQERKQLDQAEAWYQKALQIYRRLGLGPGVAAEYHQLGMLAQERKQFDEAEAWYCNAFAIEERLGLERELADEYHQLGMLAQEQQQFDQAEVGYSKALEIYQRLAYPPLMVNTLAQVGLLRREQKRLDEAILWFGRALYIASEYDMRVALQILVFLAQLVRLMGEDAFAAAWNRGFPGVEPPLEDIHEVLKQMESKGE